MIRTLVPCLLLAAVPAASLDAPPKDAAAIVAEASGKLLAALTAAIAEGGSSAAIGVCSEKAPEITGAVGKANQVVLRRITEKPRRPANAASEAERRILAAFAADIKDGRTPAPRMVEDASGKAFYAPIVIPGALCLQCHGDPDRDIAPGTLAAIRKLYPEDKATGYKAAELRGAWKVSFETEP